MNYNFSEIIQLIDIYGKLLTPTKLQYLTKYYFEDMSLNEIAKEYNISRAAIHSSIISGVKELKFYENKLNFLKKQKKRIKLYEQLNNSYLQNKLLDLEFSKKR